ncbi:MAG: hypothetical protein ACLQAT_14530 [Candidatus Binataceae bacterium]
MADTNLNRDIDGAAEAIQRASAAGRQALEEGYETAREYGEKSIDLVGQLGDSLADFVRREPLIAVGAAVLVGFVAAKLLRRIA